MKPVVPQSFGTDQRSSGSCGRPRNFGSIVCRTLGSLLPVDPAQQPFLCERGDRVAGGGGEVVAPGAAPQPRQQRLVGGEVRPADSDARRLRESDVRLRVHVVDPVVVVQRPGGRRAGQRAARARGGQRERSTRRQHASAVVGPACSVAKSAVHSGLGHPRDDGRRADPRRARPLRRTRDRRRDDRRGSRGGRKGLGCRRPQLHRLCGRHRVPEHRARLPAGGRGDPRAGRPLPAPVLHGRRLRALRRGLQAACGAVTVRWRRAALDPRQLRRRGDRERREDRPGGDGQAGGDRLRERVPRADAADDDDDGEARLQEGLRPIRARGLPRTGPVPVPRRLERRCAGGAGGSLPLGRRPGVGCLRGARARAGRGRVHPHARGLPRRG